VVENMMDINTLIQSWQMVADQMSALLSMYGLKLELERVEINEDEKTISFVYTLRCQSEAVCERIIEEFRRREDVGGGGEEKG